MNKEEKFEVLYKKLVDENATELEIQKQEAFKERKRNVKIGIILILVLLISSVSMIKVLNIQDGEIQEIIILYTILISLFITFALARNSAMEKFENNFKNKIIRQLIKSFDDTLEYKTQEGIDSRIYSEAQFEEYNVYNSSELITGTINRSCKLNLAEVITKNQIKCGNGRRITKNSFSGLFAQIETPKIFDTTLYITKDIKDTTFLGQLKKVPFNEEKTQLDSQEFEKIFDIYSSDKIVAMQLLTADIMELMIQFYNQMNIVFEITIKNKFIYIRFHSANNFEIVPLNKFALDRENIYERYKILDFVFELTNKLVKLIDETPYI